MLTHAGGVGGGRVHQPGVRSMDKKEDTGSDGRAQVPRRIPRRFWSPCESGELHLHSGRGVSMRGLSMPRNEKSGAIGGPRGKVGGWSSASRRRLRQALLTLSPAGGVRVACVGCTFTVPGPVLSGPEYRALWAWFGLALAKARIGMVWRMEVQERGAVHWHGIAVGASGGVGQRMGSKWHPGVQLLWDGRESAEWLNGTLNELWHAGLDRMGGFRYRPGVPVGKDAGAWAGKMERVPYPDSLSMQYTRESDGSGIKSVATLSRWPGADVHAYDGDGGADGWAGAWLRYLQDHASKRKQGQVGQGYGRHWGIAYRRGFVQREPDAVMRLGERAFWRFLRACQRLATPSRPADCVFGRRLGWRVRRGSVGRSVWFSRPETIARIAEWARSTAPEGEGGAS